MEQDKNVWIWVFVAVAMLLLFGSFGMGGYGMMGFGMGFGFLFMILFWGVVVWLVISLINAAQLSKRERRFDKTKKEICFRGNFKKAIRRNKKRT